MDHKELIDTIVKNKAKKMVEPLQLPEKPKKLKSKAIIKKLAPSLSITEGRGGRYHWYPVALTAKTKAKNRAEPLQLPKEPQQPKQDVAEPDAEVGTKP